MPRASSAFSLDHFHFLSFVFIFGIYFHFATQRHATFSRFRFFLTKKIFVLVSPISHHLSRVMLSNFHKYLKNLALILAHIISFYSLNVKFQFHCRGARSSTLLSHSSLVSFFFCFLRFSFIS